MDINSKCELTAATERRPLMGQGTKVHGVDFLYLQCFRIAMNENIAFYYRTLPKMKWSDCVIPCVPNVWLLPSCVTDVICLSPASHAGLSTAAGVVFKKTTKQTPPNNWGVISDRKRKEERKKKGFKNHVERLGPAFCLEIFF